MLVAIGIKNCACIEVSNNSGVSPAIVVSDVSSTARRRKQADSMSASLISNPFALSRL